MQKSIFQKGAPTRQGFYKVETEDGQELIAEWREYSKKQGKVWWVYVSDDPTIAKAKQLLEGVVGWDTVQKAEVDKALARELTLEEKIQASYNGFRSHRGLYPAKPWPMPDSRRLQIGDKVEVGNLKDAEVIGLHDEGTVVTIKYHNSRSEYGREVDRGYALNTWYWLDVLRLEDMQTTNLTSDSVMRYLTYSNSDLNSLISKMANCGTSDNPDYQRGYAWTDADKELYLDSLFEGRELGRFIFVRNPYPKADEVFDGKQRLSTVMELVTSQRPYKGVYWHQMSPRDRGAIERRSVQFAELDSSRLSRADLLRIFLAVNAAGVPQTKEHLAFVQSLLDAEVAKTA